MPVMRIVPTGGLCNRLRVIFSYRLEALKQGASLEVQWRPSQSCVGHFLDVFQAVPGVDLVTDLSGEVDYRGWQHCCPPDYSPLRPKPNVQRSLARNLEQLGDTFAAVHVRRTDHTQLAKDKGRFTPDEKFFEFVEATRGPLFLATDEQTVQREFRRRYGDRIRAADPFDHPDQLRQTSLLRSVVDLYTCVKAAQFMGSGWSSFSGFILTLREQQRALPCRAPGVPDRA